MLCGKILAFRAWGVLTSHLISVDMAIKLADLKEQHPIRLLLVVLGLFSSVVFVLTHIEWTQNKFDLWVAHLAGLDHFHSTTLFYFVFTVCLALVWCAAFAITQWRLRKAVTVHGDGGAAKALRETTLAVENIIYDQDLSKYALVSYKDTRYIHRNFDGDVRREWEIKAVKVPVHFYPVTIRVQEQAESVWYLEQIGLEVQDSKPEHKVVVLPGKSGPHNVSALLVFVPPIDPSESEPRKLVLKYEWKAMWKQLASDEHEHFEWELDSLQTIPFIEFEVLLEQGGDRVLTFEDVRQSKKLLPEPIERKHGNSAYPWKGYKCRAANVEAGHSKHPLLVRLRRT